MDRELKRWFISYKEVITLSSSKPDFIDNTSEELSIWDSTNSVRKVNNYLKSGLVRYIKLLKKRLTRSRYMLVQ